MKTYVQLTILMALFLAGCSSAYQTAAVHDDIYYSRNQAEIAAEEAHQANAAVVQVNPSSESKPAGNYNPDEQDYQQETYADESDESGLYYDEKTDTYYDADGNIVQYQEFHIDNYYDYSYSSRIRRFHRDWVSFGYYDPYFTNMYWYNYDPYFYGTSIYMGYNSLIFPSSYYSWGYRPWGWAQYGYGWGYGNPWGGFWAGHQYGYWSGYHHGFWDGYYGGLYGYPYGNYYYGNNETITASYGPRRPSGSFTSGAGRGDGRYSATGTKQSVAETGRIEGRDPANVSTKETPARTTTPATAREAGTTSGVESSRPQIAQRPAVESREQATEQRKKPVKYEPQRKPQDYQTPVTSQQREMQKPRYTRPETAGERNRETPQTSVRPRTYTSPSQQQPRSNQEYRRPSSEQRPSATSRDAQAPQRVRPEGNQPARPQATPLQRPVQTRPQAVPQRTPSQNRPQAAPQRTPSQNRPQAAPRPSNNNRRPQATPSRSPQRSSPSNVRTSPSRSSSGNSGFRSSPPSRSSGSSSSSRSSSSGSRRR